MNETTILPDLKLGGDSTTWKNWQSQYINLTTCQDCRKKHGKIYDFEAEQYQPEHELCRCSIIPMRTKKVGTATDWGFDGADAWLMYEGRLPLTCSPTAPFTKPSTASIISSMTFWIPFGFS